MKLFGGAPVLVALFGVVWTVNGFVAPWLPNNNKAHTVLNLRTDQEVWERTRVVNDNHGNVGTRSGVDYYPRTRSGVDYYPRTRSGVGYYPRYDAGQRLTRYERGSGSGRRAFGGVQGVVSDQEREDQWGSLQPDHTFIGNDPRHGYQGGTTRRNRRYPSYGSEDNYNGYGSYGYGTRSANARNYGNGYGYDYHGGRTVQGHSRKTFSTSQHDSSNVYLGSDGRPVHANVEVWQGPNHRPAAMRLYSEDGHMRPWNAGFANTNRGGYSSALTVENEGSVAFPLNADVRGYSNNGYCGRSQYVGTSRRRVATVDGGGLRTFNLSGYEGRVAVELFSDGMPIYADVEVWQGPGNIKQMGEVYTDNGRDRPWSAVIDTYRGCTVAIRNVGPLEFPLKASVEPL